MGDRMCGVEGEVEVEWWCGAGSFDVRIWELRRE
jgi:hypothetical protein